MENYTNYSPTGLGLHNSKHGYNGTLSCHGNNYLLGNGNRLYISKLGIFNQKDNKNISTGGGINSYSYAKQDSINQYDPSGNSSTGFYTGNILGLITGISGVVLALPTGGASLTITAGVSIAFAGAEVAATSTSVVLYSVDHKEGANIASWVSLGLGLASLGTGSVSALNKTQSGVTSSISSGSVSHSLSSTSSARTKSFNFDVFTYGSVDVEIGNVEEINSLGLLEAEDFSVYGMQYVHRLDRKTPLEIETNGFYVSQVFGGVEKMLNEDALIVAENLKGVKAFSELTSSTGNVYKIDIRGVKGVSLNHNLLNNKNGLLKHKKQTEPNLLNSLSLSNLMFEAHLDITKINAERQTRVKFESIISNGDFLIS